MTKGHGQQIINDIATAPQGHGKKKKKKKEKKKKEGNTKSNLFWTT